MKTIALLLDTKHVVLTALTTCLLLIGFALSVQTVYAATPEVELQEVLLETENILYILEDQVSGSKSSGGGLVLGADSDSPSIEEMLEQINILIALIAQLQQQLLMMSDTEAVEEISLVPSTGGAVAYFEGSKVTFNENNDTILDDNTGEFVIEFELEAFDEDIFVPVASEKDGYITMIFKDSSGKQIPSDYLNSLVLFTDSTADVDDRYSERFIVKEGTVETFTVRGDINPKYTDSYKAEIVSIPFYSSGSDFLSYAEFDDGDLYTRYLYIRTGTDKKDDAYYDLEIKRPVNGTEYEPGDSINLSWDEENLGGEYGVVTLEGNNTERHIAERVDIGNGGVSVKIPVSDSLGSVTDGVYELKLWVSYLKDGDPKGVSDTVKIKIDSDDGPVQSEIPTCKIETNKYTYVYGEEIEISWSSENTDYLKFTDFSPKDTLNLPTGKLDNDDEIEVTANVTGNPLIELTAYGEDGETNTCSRRIEIKDQSNVDSLEVNLIDTDEKLESGATTQGDYVIKFEVTAVDDDVYIPSQSAINEGSSRTGVLFNIYDGAKGLPYTSGSVLSSLDSTADEVNGRFEVTEGTTETFTLSVSFTPKFTATYRAQIDWIRYFDSAYVSSVKVMQKNVSEEDLNTNYLLIQDMGGSETNLDRAIVVGAYEGSYQSGVSSSFGYHPEGGIDVYLPDGGDNVNMLLVLSSYEPVAWDIGGPGVKNVGAVFVTGYYQQRVNGLDSSVPVNSRTIKGDGNEFYVAYDRNSSDYAELSNYIKNKYDVNITQFYGNYSQSFVKVVGYKG